MFQTGHKSRIEPASSKLNAPEQMIQHPYTVDEWINEIDKQTAEFKNYEMNHSSEKALTEIFSEVETLAGAQARQELGERTLEIIEYRRHPKAHRIRDIARDIVVNEYDVEPPASSPLLKSRIG